MVLFLFICNSFFWMSTSSGRIHDIHDKLLRSRQDALRRSRMLLPRVLPHETVLVQQQQLELRHELLEPQHGQLEPRHELQVRPMQEQQLQRRLLQRELPILWSGPLEKDWNIFTYDHNFL